jgi:FADH2 O2-dependent halogenase
LCAVRRPKARRWVVKRDIVIIGSGFAGSVLARLLALGGRDVLLVERDAHPRFALGESSTPLAALSLERLARRYRQPDLASLAAHGRWRRNLAGLRCGQKRGFTFYRQHPGEPYANSDANEARFLVAASPDAEVADCHWMRADVDAYLVEQARAVGVDYRDRLEIRAVELVPDGLRLHGRHGGREIEIEAGFVVDASGAGEVLARALGIESTGHEVGFSSRLVYAHFEGVEPFADTALGAGACLPAGPYADDRAAVHHLIDEGWIYALRFDDGLTSVGLLIDLAAAGGCQVSSAENPDALWRGVVERYPTLRAAFAGARPLPPGLRATARLQRRRRRATGARWAMLPQTFAFFDPLFSTGIAWSLLGVERLAELLMEPVVATTALDRYAALLMAEADQQQALLEAAYTARRDFGVFRELSFLYFASVSFEEIRQRLLDRPPDRRDDTEAAWRGLLGAGDPHWTRLFRDAAGRVAETLVSGSGDARLRFAAWVAAGIRSRNLAGLGASPTHLYGVDTAQLVASSALLGLTAAEMESLLPRLRGSTRVG